MRWFLTALLLVSAAAAQTPSAAGEGGPDWSPVEKALGRAGKLEAGIYKVTFPRTDLTVRVGKTVLESGAALTSWMAFRTDPSGIITDGDLVLLEGEINPVISALQEHGLEISALHNHLTGEQPQIMYVHFFARGELARIAEGLKAALAQTRTPTGPAAQSKAVANFGQKEIEQIMGKSGTVNGKVLGFSFPREHPISMHGAALPPAMGMATAINFQPSATGVAATGDFVLREREVNPVVSKLRAGGVNVTAVHNHMLDDEPRMVFVHFWAEGKAEVVAKALREALDAAR